MKRVLAIMSICACLCGGAALADVQRSNRLVVDVYPFDSDKEWEAASDVALVADVEGVYFDSTENVNWSVNSRDMTLPEAVYRIELLVRKVEKGDFPYERVAFRLCMCIHGPLWTDWPFYRGITLGVSLRMVDGALRVRQVRPVLPYPPFSPCARAFRYSLRDVDPSSSSRFMLNERAAVMRPGGAVEGLVLQYGEHTLAKFLVSNNGITNTGITVKDSKFTDYSRGTSVEVWTASEGANPGYWCDAWFAKPQNPQEATSGEGKSCTVHNAEEGLDDLSLLKFRWFPCRVGSWCCKPMTLDGFAERLDEATVCVGCGRRHYRLSIDPSVAARKVQLPESPFPSGYIAFEALERACERAGCQYKVDGTNILVSALLTDSEFADDSLQGWLRALEKHGFASAAGAQYVCLWGLESRDFFAYHPITDFPSGEYRMTGNGWIRMAADGKYDVLAFDSEWWPNDSMGKVVLKKARLSRDIAKMRACLRDAVECPDATSWRRAKHDRAALAFALHVHQAGHAEEAQALVDELKRRPDAASAAFTSLLSMVRNAKKNYPDFKSWQENPHALGADAASAPAAPGTETPRREAEVPGQVGGKEPATYVCPLSPVEVAGEGRGIVGHVCDAPLTLVEAEALEFIENEFLRRGVKLKDCPELDGVALPSDPKRNRPVMLDFGTESGDIMVEFISRLDVEPWTKCEESSARRRVNIIDIMDFRAAATNAVNAIAARKTGRSVTVCVLYDPAASLPEDWKPSKTETAVEERQAAKLSLEQKQLKAQIDAFFDYLAKRGTKHCDH